MVEFKDQLSVNVYRIDTAHGYAFFLKKEKNVTNSRREEHDFKRFMVEENGHGGTNMFPKDPEFLEVFQYLRDSNDFVDADDDIFKYLGGISEDEWNTICANGTSEVSQLEGIIEVLEKQPHLTDIRDKMRNDQLEEPDCQIYGCKNLHVQSSFNEIGHVNGRKLLTADALAARLVALPYGTEITLIDKDLEGGMRKTAIGLVLFETGIESEGVPRGLGTYHAEVSKFTVFQDHAVIAVCGLNETNNRGIDRYRYVGGHIFQILPKD